MLGVTQAAKPDHFVEHGAGDTLLVGERHMSDFAVGSEQRDRVRVVLEPDAGCRHVVGHDQIHTLAGQLGLGIGDEIGGLRGETDDRLARASSRTEFGEDVAGGFKLDRPESFDAPRGWILLQLLGRYRDRANVGDGGRQPGQFYAAHSIATDSMGNVYTAETRRGQRLQKFTYKGLGPVTKKDQGVLWPKTAKSPL